MDPLEDPSDPPPELLSVENAGGDLVSENPDTTPLFSTETGSQEDFRVHNTRRKTFPANILETLAEEQEKPVPKQVNVDGTGRRLCASGRRVCQQRPLDGSEYCFKHILEDSNAPYVQCVYMCKVSERQCSNAVAVAVVGNSDESRLCPSHRSMLGLAPRKNTTATPRRTIGRVSKQSTEDQQNLSESARRIKKVLQKHGMGFRSQAAQQRIASLQENSDSSDAELSDTCDETVQPYERTFDEIEQAVLACGTISCLDGDPLRNVGILTEEEMIKRKADRADKLLHMYQTMLSRLERKLKRSYSEAGESATISLEDVKRLATVPQLSSTCVFVIPGVTQSQNCTEKALPFSSFCYTHILSDPHQKLFGPCAYKAYQPTTLPRTTPSTPALTPLLPVKSSMNSTIVLPLPPLASVVSLQASTRDISPDRTSVPSPSVRDEKDKDSIVLSSEVDDDSLSSAKTTETKSELILKQVLPSPVASEISRGIPDCKHPALRNFSGPSYCALHSSPATTSASIPTKRKAPVMMSPRTPLSALASPVPTLQLPPMAKTVNSAISSLPNPSSMVNLPSASFLASAPPERTLARYSPPPLPALPPVVVALHPVVSAITAVVTESSVDNPTTMEPTTMEL